MREPISLSLAERRILTNQNRILAKLEPENVEQYEELATIFECGYSLEYIEALGVWEETPQGVCEEVLDIMDMFNFLQMSFDALTDKGGITERDVSFSGFDGNNEESHLAYADFYCQSKRRFGNLRFEGGKVESQFTHGVSLNGHFPVLEGYRRMLQPWREFKKENRGQRWGRMTIEEMRAILDEAVHPDSRGNLNAQAK